MSPALLNGLLVLVPAAVLAVTVLVYAWTRARGRPLVLAGLPGLVCGVLAILVSHRIGDVLNPVSSEGPGAVGEAALALHRDTPVIDLHADPLLFGRDLLERSDAGHVDVPRLLEGGVALQVFSLVTRAPLGYNEEATNPDRPDLVTWIALTHFWPPRTWFDLHQRVLHHAGRLERMAEGSGGRLGLVRDRDDLEALLAARRAGRPVVGGLLAIEGAHVLSGDFRSQLDVLFEHGLRMASFTHFFDNAFAGSVQGLEKGGLTARGRELLAELERRGIVVDLAHASHATIEDVLAAARRPVVFSHTGVAGTCDQLHNLTDRHLRAIAENGGGVGIGLWDTAVCGTRARDTVRAMRHVIDLVGDAHVGLGSDFDGAVRAHFDASALPSLTQAMLDAGLAPDTVRRILGGNVLRVLRAVLP